MFSWMANWSQKSKQTWLAWTCGVHMKFYSSTFVALFHGAGRAWMFIVHICFKSGQWRTILMCFYCILKGLFCIHEGTKTSGHGLEQAILSGQFLGYLCLLVFSEKHNSLTCWFFRVFIFCCCCWTTGVLVEYRNPKTNILPFSLLQSFKYDEFCSLFNVGKKQRCDTVLYSVVFNFLGLFIKHKIILEDVWINLF